MRRGPGRAAAVLAAVLVLLALPGCGGAEPAPVAAPRGEARAVADPGCPPLGQRSTSATALPDLELRCLRGAGEPGIALSLRRLTGTPTVLNLWATWCAPCRQELPALARLHRDGGSRVRVLGVVTQDRRAAALSYAADAGLPFPSLEDPDGELGRALRRPGLPLTVLLAADGAVAGVYQGPALTDGTLRRLVREKLGVDVG